MGGKSQPDFGDIAASQGEENEKVIRDQTYANRPTQYTPWGYTNWTNESVVDPSTGENVTKWSQTQGLTPELQDILDKQTAITGGRTDLAGMLTGRAGQEFSQQMDWSGLNPMGERPVAQYTLPEGGINDPNQTRQRAEDMSYNSAMSRVTPQFEEQKRAAEVKMRNQGLSPQDSAWKTQMEGITQGENDARDKAIWGANSAGRAEAGQMFGQELGLNQNRFNQALGSNNQNWNQSMQGSQYSTQLRQQQLTEEMQKRGFSLNEINGLLSGQQVNTPNMPNFSQASSAQPAPIYQGAADQASINAANNPMNALIGAGGALGSAYLGG